MAKRGMVAVYRLSRDKEHLESVQRATLNTKKSGLRPTHGLFGSPEWWGKIESGELPIHRLRGVIIRLFMGGMNDWPEFTIKADSGKESNWARAANSQDLYELYAVGLPVELDYVIQRSKYKSWLGTGEKHKCVLEIRLGDVASITEPTVTLYRPTGPKELELVRQSGFKRWPPRLPDQPIFYPVTNETYATRITTRWNVEDSGVGYVTRFRVRKAFMDRYTIHQVGASHHTEWWIPAEELDDLNDNIVGVIEVLCEHRKRA